MMMVSAFVVAALAFSSVVSISAAHSLNIDANPETLEPPSNDLANGSIDRSLSQTTSTAPAPTVVVNHESRLRSEFFDDEEDTMLPFSETSLHHPSPSLGEIKLADTGLTFDATSPSVPLPIVFLEPLLSETPSLTPSLTPSVERTDPASSATPSPGLMMVFFETMAPDIPSSTNPTDASSTPPFSSNVFDFPTFVESPATTTTATIASELSTAPAVGSSMPSSSPSSVMFLQAGNGFPVGPFVQSSTPISSSPSTAPVLNRIMNSDAPSYDPTLSQPSGGPVMIGFPSPSESLTPEMTPMPSPALAGTLSLTPSPTTLAEFDPTATPTIILLAAPFTFLPTKDHTTMTFESNIPSSTLESHVTNQPSTFSPAPTTSPTSDASQASSTIATMTSKAFGVETMEPTMSSLTFAPSSEPTLLTPGTAATTDPTLVSFHPTDQPTVAMSLTTETLDPSTFPTTDATITPTTDILALTTSPSTFPTVETSAPTNNPIQKKPTIQSPHHSYSRHRGSQFSDSEDHQWYYSHHHRSSHHQKFGPTKVPEPAIKTPVSPVTTPSMSSLEPHYLYQHQGRGKPPMRSAPTRMMRDRHYVEWW